MKIAVKKSPMDVILRDIDLRDIDKHEILLKVKSCGVCGGDLNSSEEYKPFGHEMAGIVEKTGDSVTGIKAGDTVVIESGSFCGVCNNCRDGRVDLCRHFIPGSYAGFAEYAIVPAKNAVVYEGISFKQASIIEPLGVAIDLVYTADIKLNDHVLIIGGGTIGLMALSLAKAMGASKVFVAQPSRSIRKIELAKAFGAEDIIFTDQQSIEDYKFPKGGVDKVLVTAPPKTIPPAFQVMNYNGTLAFLGFSSDSEITFDANRFHRKKLQLKGAFAAPGLYYPTAIDMIKNGVINTDLLISHTFRLDETAKIMSLLANDRGSVVKCVMLD